MRTGDVPTVVTVPEKAPSAFIVTPAGSEPDTIDQVACAPLPPEVLSDGV